MDRRIAAHAAPNVDDTELGGLLADLTDASNIHHGIHLITAGIRAIAEDASHDQDATMLLLAQLAGSPDGTDVLTAIGLLVARLTNPDTNPALRALDHDTQKTTQRHGENLVHHLADPDLHQHASNASGSIHTD